MLTRMLVPRPTKIARKTLKEASATARPTSTSFPSDVAIGLIHMLLDAKRYPTVQQAAMILEAGICTTEHLEMDTANQHSYILKIYKAL